MNIPKTLPVIRVAAFLFALAAVAGAQIPGLPKAPANPNPELIGTLTKELNVTPAQATGGAGAIFGLAKSQLNPAAFSKIAAAVPGMDGLLKAAPAVQGGSPLGSFESVLPAKAGGIASLAGSFKSLGLSPDMVGKFVPVLQNYVQSKGGAGIASLLAGGLK